MKKYYDGTKLLSMTDINGKKPELYLCSSNRSAGKTFYFSKMLINRYLKKKEKFVLLYRFSYEIDNVADKFFRDIGSMYFKEYEMIETKKSRGKYIELYLIPAGAADEISKEKLKDYNCGYAVAINDSEQVRRLSHLMGDATSVFFDEFQSETNRYCPDEIQKFISVHTSLARGGGSQVKYLPVYMCSNPVSILNPYYTALDISARLNDKTKFLRGSGFVLEFNLNENARVAQETSAFNSAFKDVQYTAFASAGLYLNDTKAFIERPRGRGRYLCTLKLHDEHYAIREFLDLGIIYCDDRPDFTSKNLISATTADHDKNYVMLGQYSWFIEYMRGMFENGAFRFKNLKCKKAVIEILSY